MTPLFASIPLGRAVQQIRQKAVASDFKIALENIESWTGRLIENETASFESEGIAFSKGDVLFGKLRPYLAKVIEVGRNGSAVGDLWVLRPVKYTPRYLKYLLLDKTFIDAVHGATFGSRMPRVSWDIARHIKLPHPEINKQQDIADFLDRETAKIDKLIAKQEQLITTLGERRLTLVSVAVSGLDLRQELNEQSDPNWPQVPKSWDLVALKRVLAIPMTDGPHETPEFFDEGIEFISAESVSSGEIDFAKRRGFISAQEHSRYCLKYKPKMNDIYVVKSGATTGRSAILREERDFNIWSPLAVIRCGRRANPFFMHYAIQSRQFQQAISLSWTFGTQQNIGMSTLQNLKVPVPAFELQSKIVQSLDLKLTSIHRLTSACKRQLGLLTERRQSLISAAVTGKIDLSKGL